MREGPLFDPRDFIIADGIAHLCAGGRAPACIAMPAAFSRYLRDKSSGMAGRVAQEAEIARARAGIARAWGVDAASIGFVGNVAEGVSIVAESLDWRDGDNLVVDANEYPSVVGPFLARRNPRVTLRQARGTAPDRFAECVDARTRVIGVSYVSYLTGERHDLSALRALADSVGALLVVDFTQAAGYLPIEASIADFAFSACYKWLLGVTGVAVAYWNRARQPEWSPASAGWYSFEPGSRGYDNPPPLRRRCAALHPRQSRARFDLRAGGCARTIWPPATCATFRRTSRHDDGDAGATGSPADSNAHASRSGAARCERLHSIAARASDRRCDGAARGAGMERPGTHPFQLPRLQLAPGRRSGDRHVERGMGLISALRVPLLQSKAGF
jgi:hypothetical protein